MSNITKENTYEQEVAPLLDKLVEICEKNDFPMMVAVQLYTNLEQGARIAAQSVETPDTAIHLLISSKILRGEAKVTIQDEDTFSISLSDAPIEQETESLAEHSTHCDSCRESMEERIARGEDISSIRIVKHDSNPLEFFKLPSKTIH